MARHAEIVGGGFGGLVAATALAARGWSVRLHERHAAMRAEGFGIAIMNNVSTLFRALGVYDEIAAGGIRIDRRESFNGRHELVFAADNVGDAYRISRHHIVGVLAARARDRGAEIVTGSEVTAVTRDGTVETAAGARHEGDLVVVANGIGSALPARLGLAMRRVAHPVGGVRMTIPRTAAEIAHDAAHGTVIVEAWAGRRRVLYCPNAADELYVILTCGRADAAARAMPVDVGAWAATFPHLRALLARVRDETDWAASSWAGFETRRLARWSAGRVAVLGDAAHAMTPFLGQGAGCAMMNALALAVHLERHGDPAAALAAWEAAERPLTEHTQRWSRIYGWSILLPDALKPAFIAAERRLPWLHRRYWRTANTVPTGCAAAA